MRTERFEGTIGATLAESTPDFDTPPDPGPGAPDVLVIVLDDTGFAQLGCFGSDIDTPNIDALAADGVVFTNFHVTPLCSPPGLRCSPVAATTTPACAACRTSAPGSPTCSATSHTAPRPWPRSSPMPAGPPSPSASGTWPPWRSARPPDRSTSGPSGEVSTASTDSSTARPTSSTRRSPSTTTTSTRPRHPRTATT